VSETLIVAGLGAAVGIAGILTTLFIHYDRKKPAIVVYRNHPESHFKERIMVHNRNQTAYSYRIRVGPHYQKWLKGGQNAVLAQDYGDAVILDEVYYELSDHDIVIECRGWWPWVRIVFKKRIDEIDYEPRQPGRSGRVL